MKDCDDTMVEVEHIQTMLEITYRMIDRLFDGNPTSDISTPKQARAKAAALQYVDEAINAMANYSGAREKME